jgi:hypothetical protein
LTSEAADADERNPDRYERHLAAEIAAMCPYDRAALYE